jgi:hypothetical protein
MKKMLVFMLVWMIHISAQSGDTASILRSSKGDTVPSVKSPWLSGWLSALLPGGGQVYTGHYIKAGAFAALEVSTALNARFWYSSMQFRTDEIVRLRKEADSIQDATLRYRSLEEVNMNKFGYKRARYNMYNALSWMISGYVYNILDAVNSTGCFKSDDERSPLRAGWLAAIPGLGLGQFYNGEVSKAGMVMMVQASLGVIVINEHNLMKRAEDNLNRIAVMSDTTRKEIVQQYYLQDWEAWRGTAKSNRNTYLWYSIFFYLYTIFDAVVDAHLHDYPKKIRAYPDLIPEQQALRLTVDYYF